MYIYYYRANQLHLVFHLLVLLSMASATSLLLLPLLKTWEVFLSSYSED